MYLTSNELVQVGLEAAYQDGATPTVYLAGVDEISLTPHVEAHQLIDKRGSSMPSHQSYITKRWSEWNVGGFLNYLQAYIWLDAIFGKDATPPRTYLAAVLEDPTACQSLVLQYGQSGPGVRATGLMVDRLQISGESDGPVKYTAHLTGKAAIDDGPEALSEVKPGLVMGQHCQIYLDPITSAVGSTELDVTGYQYTADVALPGRKPVWYFGSGVENGAHAASRWGGSMHLVLEMTAAMFAYYTAILDAVEDAEGYTVRLKHTDTLGTSIFQLDFAGEAIIPPSFSTNKDGIVTLDLMLQPKYAPSPGILSCWAAALTLP